MTLRTPPPKRAHVWSPSMLAPKDIADLAEAMARISGLATWEVIRPTGNRRNMRREALVGIAYERGGSLVAIASVLGVSRQAAHQQLDRWRHRTPEQTRNQWRIALASRPATGAKP